MICGAKKDPALETTSKEMLSGNEALHPKHGWHSREKTA